MKRGLGRFVLALPLLLQGCLLDIAPGREPIDETWKARMLAGEFGQWFTGEKVSFVGPDEIRSSPIGADLTRYGIRISEQSTLGGGAWSMTGGIVARVVRAGESIELFGKEIVRAHGLLHMATDRDHSYEFFLVVRPTATGRGRLVRQWNFPREELALRALRESGAYKGFFIDGYLRFDEQSKTVTVTITGLVRPFEEHVDLSDELR